MTATYLLVFTPVVGVIGLAILAAAGLLLNGREIVGWRSALRGGRRDTAKNGVSSPEASVESARTDGVGVIEDGIDVEEAVDLESTPIGANLP